MNSPDISAILRTWPHEPGRLNVRFVNADDGRKLLQIRLELGLLQLETSGRPDGERPGDHESLLELHTAQRERWVAAHGDARTFVLAPAECAALREEAIQYYHRYVGLLVLEDFAGVVRDTTRNLQVFDLCRAHAATEGDRTVLEQFRPYVIMMRSRAEAAAAIAASLPKEAIAALDRGLAEIREALQEREERPGSRDDEGKDEGSFEERYEQCNEVKLLRGMREMLVPQLPVSQRTELEERLRAAIAAENYELAAILRDELRLIEE
ncbi:MAG: UvrB/UvrC motif-containing protein [Phycisphaerales bacterium]